ncbi:MAG: double-strand break repair protein AddB [Pseudomonadota bacterium]
MGELSEASVFGVPPGADFVKELFQLISDIAKSEPPEFMAEINVLVPSRRMQRRLKSLFEEGTDCLLPRIGLVTDVSTLLPAGQPASTRSDLARILDLKEVVSQLVSFDDRLSESDVIDLSLSLMKLLDEMQSEGVPLQRLEELALEDQSGHWERSLTFLRTIRDYLDALSATGQDPEGLHRANVLALIDYWSENPPDKPFIVAGSTGSRATTRMLMAATAQTQQGCVLLPGFDFDLPVDMWDTLLEHNGFEDHPQFRFASFLRETDISPSEVVQLGNAPDPLRNALVSLALRPAPVTHQWLSEGPSLGELTMATDGLSLVEAGDTKLEAIALASAIRLELEGERSVALIAPDATLARRVSAELSRWKIRPDDSGGIPLSLTPSGRFLRQTARLASGKWDIVELFSLLKHPFTLNAFERGEHMLHTHDFELFVRRKGISKVTAETLKAFADAQSDASDWADWLQSALKSARMPNAEIGSQVIAGHQSVIERFLGPGGFDLFFEGDAGQKVGTLCQEFERALTPASKTGFDDYIRLLETSLSNDSARIQSGVHPDVMIWGTLEARVQGADVVLIAGLNEGNWPEQPPSDPWLNRRMRRDVGLLLPDRQIGLAAHDFQQAIGAPKVILSRARRSDGSETVPSRWLSRLTNLLSGLPTTGGETALEDMAKRGDVYLQLAKDIDKPTDDKTPYTRPAPAPPVHRRPRELAITDVQKLIRDPYAIYARQILKLRPLDPLGPEMDPRKKGTVFHSILERYYDLAAAFDDQASCQERLEGIAQSQLASAVDDAATRLAWLSQLSNNGAWLFEREVERRAVGAPIGNEIKGTYSVPGTSFTLRGTADRIDRLKDGRLVVYDYKTGQPPSRADILSFDRQLIIEAAMAESGAFGDVPPAPVSHVVHVGVGRTPKEQVTKLEGENAVADTPTRLVALLTAFLDPKRGYVSRRAMEDVRFAGDYDHLARYGEWDDASDVVVEFVGQ